MFFSWKRPFGSVFVTVQGRPMTTAKRAGVNFHFRYRPQDIWEKRKLLSYYAKQKLGWLHGDMKQKEKKKRNEEKCRAEQWGRIAHAAKHLRNGRRLFIKKRKVEGNTAKKKRTTDCPGYWPLCWTIRSPRGGQSLLIQSRHHPFLDKRGGVVVVVVKPERGETVRSLSTPAGSITLWRAIIIRTRVDFLLVANDCEKRKISAFLGQSFLFWWKLSIQIIDPLSNYNLRANKKQN